MALGLTQPIVMKSGSLNLLEPSGPVMDCFIFTFTWGRVVAVVCLVPHWGCNYKILYKVRYF
jgi:hypothetical protein